MSDIQSLVFEQAPVAPETFNVLLYGPPGSGKSTAAATAPGPIMWLNCQGPGALAHARRVAAQRGTEIAEIRLDRNVVDVRGLLSQVMEHVHSRSEPVARTIVVDTFADLRSLLIDQIVVPGASNSIQQFGTVAKTLKDFVLWFRDQPVNFVVICHEDIADADSDRVVRPLIGGALTEQIPAEVDVLAYTGIVKTDESVRYVGQLVQGKGRRAKDRSGGLGDVRDLDLTAWLKLYRETLSPGIDELPFNASEPEPAFEEPSHQSADIEIVLTEAALGLSLGAVKRAFADVGLQLPAAKKDAFAHVPPAKVTELVKALEAKRSVAT